MFRISVVRLLGWMQRSKAPHIVLSKERIQLALNLQAADGGKHAYPESGLQIAENPLEGGASRD